MIRPGAMEKLLYIAVGGAVGSVLRHVLSGWGQRAAGGEPFPVGTLVVNVLGCLAMGVLGALFALHRGRDEWRLLLLVGLLGGFTTFSSFAFETLGLAEHGARGRALANVLLTNALCLLAVWAGYRLTQRWHGI
jgi:CrcB protein